jgi:hypothetical protein
LCAVVFNAYARALVGVGRVHAVTIMAIGAYEN